MITQSNASRASSISRRMRLDVRPAIGSELGVPAGRIVSRGDTSCSGSFGSSAAVRPSPSPGAPRTLNTVCSDGRRRSASMSSTLRLVRLAQRQREVGRRQRLAFAGDRARDHHDLEPVAAWA